MIFLLAGEGPTDMGGCRDQRRECAGADFQPGPLAVMVRQIVDHELGKIAAGWELPDDAIEFVAHAALKEAELPKARPTSSLFRGKKDKQDADDIYFFQEARILGHLAKQRSVRDASPVSPVLFHDADGRCSTKPGLWKEKADSMRRGFIREECELGVPMVTNPTSEAWLLCGLKTTPYQSCESLETTVSASDKSPNWGKKLLADAVRTTEVSGTALADMVRDGRIDALRIEMPSYRAFRDRLAEVVTQMVRSTPPPPQPPQRS